MFGFWQWPSGLRPIKNVTVAAKGATPQADIGLTPKRACVFPRYENEAIQQELVARYFASGGGANRMEVEGRIEDLVRFASGKSVRVIVYCPAQRMQLKEAGIHVRWPGTEAVRPLAEFADRVPRLGDLENSYRNLWKFYVFAGSDDPALLSKVADIAQQEFDGARNVYDAAASH